MVSRSSRMRTFEDHLVAYYASDANQGSLSLALAGEPNIMALPPMGLHVPSTCSSAPLVLPVQWDASEQISLHSLVLGTEELPFSAFCCSRFARPVRCAILLLQLPAGHDDSFRFTEAYRGESGTGQAGQARTKADLDSRASR